jgi:hypothetical protein
VGRSRFALRGIGAESLATRLAMVLLGAGLHALHLCAVAALCCFPLCCANFESLLIFLVVGVGVIVHWLANTDDWSLRPLAEAHRGLPRSWCWHARAASAIFGALDAFWRRRKYALALALALLCGSRLAALSNRELRAAELAEAAWWQAHAAAAAAWAVPGTVARVLVLPPWLRRAVAMLLLVVLQGALLRLLLSQICGDAALAHPTNALASPDECPTGVSAGDTTPPLHHSMYAAFARAMLALGEMDLGASGSPRQHDDGATLDLCPMSPLSLAHTPERARFERQRHEAAERA